MHFVWRLFVLGGSILQYICIAMYCIGNEEERDGEDSPMSRSSF